MLIENNKKHFVDCLLFSLDAVYYLLPIVAVAKIACFDKATYHSLSPQIGNLVWSPQDLLLVTPAFSAIPENTKNKNFAIIHAEFSNKKFPDYFALLMDKKPLRLRIKQNDLVWEDKEKNKILFESKKLKIIFFDRHSIAQKIEAEQSIDGIYS